MTNPTTNFGWVMPTPTDLVTDLPADFNVFGQGVDTSMADLLGGTTGQILAKASNTNMDFAWIANDQGDITAVNVTSPITGGGSSGAVTIGINAATTSVVGAVQLSDSTSTTSSVLAATPTAVKAAYDKASTAATTSVAGIVQLSDSISTTSSVLASTPTATKSAYDLANGAIAKTTVTTAGDIIYRNATVPTRLGIGTAGQVLKVNSGATAPEWATMGASGMTLVKRASFSAVATTTTTFDAVFTSTYDNYLIVGDKILGSINNADLRFQYRVSGATQAGSQFYGSYFGYSYGGTLTTNFVSAGTSFVIATLGNSTPETVGFNITAAKVVSSDTPQIFGTAYESNRAVPLALGAKYNSAIAADGFILSSSSGTITGTVSVYGLAKA